MKLFKLIFVFSLLLLALTQVFSQNKTLGETNKNNLIDESKPAVYLEFVKTGKCTKDYLNFNFGNLCQSKSEETYTFDAFWVRFVNNTRWTIGVTADKGATEANADVVLINSTASVSKIGEKTAIGKMLAKDSAEMDVVYKAESETGCDFGEDTPKGQVCKRRETSVPEIPLPPISSDLFVPSGQSIIFPVNREHIKKYIDLYVIFNFEWEYSGKFYSSTPHYDLQHRAYFSWFDLETGLKKEAKK